MLYHLGEVWRGSWSRDVLTGVGVYKGRTGDDYRGDFLDGKRHGRGVYTWKADGRRYEGQWESDARHGDGVETYADGARLTGRFGCSRAETCSSRRFIFYFFFSLCFNFFA